MVGHGAAPKHTAPMQTKSKADWHRIAELFATSYIFAVPITSADRKGRAIRGWTGIAFRYGDAA